MKCAIYVRVSTEEQANQKSSTLDSQTEYCKRFIELNKEWELVEIYREEGISGTTLNRPQFQRLLRDSRAKKFEILLVNDIDRLGRNLRDFLNVWQIFDENGVKFISINQNLDTSTIMGRALIQLLMVFAELEVNMIRQRTSQKRKYDVVDKGRWFGGLAPVGYDYDKKIKSLVPNEKESRFVIKVFNLYLKYESIAKVCEKLNNEKYKTKIFKQKDGSKRGGKFINDNYVSRILKSQVYIGKVNYKGEWHPGNHSPILSEDKFNKVQDILKKNRERCKSDKRKRSHPFMLSGLVRCGDCGYSMTPKTGTGRKQTYLYYDCVSNKKAPGQNLCKLSHVSAPELEKVVLWGLREIINKKGYFAKRIDNTNKDLKAKVDELELKKKNLQKKLKEYKCEGRKLVDLLTADKVRNIKKIDDRLGELEKLEKTAIENIELIDFDIMANKRNFVDGDGLKYYLNQFNKYSDDMPYKAKKNALQVILKEVLYNKNRVKISLRDISRLSIQKETDFPLTGSLSLSSFGADGTVGEPDRCIDFELSFNFKNTYDTVNKGKLFRKKIIDPDSLALTDEDTVNNIVKFPRTL